MSKLIQAVVIAVIKRGDTFLFTRRVEQDPEDSDTHHFWQLPGGAVEFGETPEQAVIREVREEVNLAARIKTIIPFIPAPVRNNVWQGILIPFLCTVDDAAEVVLNDEADAYGWYTLAEARSLKSLEYCMEMVEAALEIDRILP